MAGSEAAALVRLSEDASPRTNSFLLVELTTTHGLPLVLRPAGSFA